MSEKKLTREVPVDRIKPPRAGETSALRIKAAFDVRYLKQARKRTC